MDVIFISHDGRILTAEQAGQNLADELDRLPAKLKIIEKMEAMLNNLKADIVEQRRT